MSQENMSDSQKLSKLYQKLSMVKAEMGKVSKTAKNPYFNSTYADLNSHLGVVEPLLQKHGLVLTQPVVAANSQQGFINVVKTEITDSETGAQISSSLALSNMSDMQKLGGAITYARRYTLSAALAMQAEDDDGNTAVGKGTKKQSKSMDF